MQQAGYAAMIVRLYIDSKIFVGISCPSFTSIGWRTAPIYRRGHCVHRLSPIFIRDYNGMPPALFNSRQQQSTQQIPPNIAHVERINIPASQRVQISDRRMMY